MTTQFCVFVMKRCRANTKAGASDVDGASAIDRASAIVVVVVVDIP